MKSNSKYLQCCSIYLNSLLVYIKHSELYLFTISKPNVLNELAILFVHREYDGLDLSTYTCLIIQLCRIHFSQTVSIF